MNSFKQDGPIDLLELYKRPSVNHISGFCNAIYQLKPTELVTAYHRTRETAPHRHKRTTPLRYFVGHTGVTSSGTNSNRREEHQAVALWNATQKGVPLVLPEDRKLNLLDYQLPLKARRGDKGIGKVDLFGVIDGVQSCVIELKIHPAGQGLGDTPLRAFLEALAYCAIVEANAGDIAEEADEGFGLKLTGNRPALIVMASTEYWSNYLTHNRTGEWWPALRNLADQLAESLGLECHFIALKNSEFSMGLNGQKPQLLSDCSMLRVADIVGI